MIRGTVDLLSANRGQCHLVHYFGEIVSHRVVAFQATTGASMLLGWNPEGWIALLGPFLQRVAKMRVANMRFALPR